MNKNYLLQLLNNQQIDVGFLFKHYVENGGIITNIEQFHIVLQMYVGMFGFDMIYNRWMIEYSVHKLYDKEGIVIKYY